MSGGEAVIEEGSIRSGWEVADSALVGKIETDMLHPKMPRHPLRFELLPTGTLDQGTFRLLFALQKLKKAVHPENNRFLAKRNNFLAII